MARILNSPSQNVAGEQLVLLETATLEIKKLIISGASQKQIQAVINNYCMRFANEQTQAVFRRNLIQSANKMLYEYNYNMKIVNQMFINQVIKAFPVGTGTTLSNNTYTVDLTAIYAEYLNGNINQRKVITEFRNRISNAKKGLALIKDYDSKVIEQTKLLASEPVKYIAKDGRAISLRNKVEMAVRYEANMKDLEQYKALGIKLVWTSSHADASPRCAPFQGRLWSLDGTSGTIDGIKYEPIENALNANGGNSIINGYNCRHYLIEWEKGSVAPRHFTSKEIQKEYRIDQRQRQYENEIRHKKTTETLLRQQGFTEEASKMRKQWQNLNKRYEEYSIKNGRAFYRWRTRISDEERQNRINPFGNKETNNIIKIEPVKIEITGKLKDDKWVNKAFENVQTNDKIVAELYNLVGSKNKDLKFIHSSKRAYQQGNTISINNTDTFEGKMTAYHEIGHYIDQLAQEQDGSFYLGRIGSTEELKNSLTAETFDDYTGERIKELFGKITPKILETQKKSFEWKTNNSKLAQELYDSKLSELSGCVVKEGKILENPNKLQVREIMKYSKEAEKYSKKEYEQIKENALNLKNGEEENKNILFYDMIDAMTYGRATSKENIRKGYGVSWGHGSAFRDLETISAELFANFMALKVKNANEQLDEFKKLFPKTYDSLEKYKDIALERIKNEK
ncbi:MAG: phage minor capsid protein [Prevotella sp.]|nr:phage minor capsid protein [Staphylococcus sp.]MCM1349890.1 phage minor capsid protein [Prevotella sp.]